MAESIHEKLKRVRKPRVHITYEVETNGALVEREIPFVMGVMGDFSGDNVEGKKELKDRKFAQIDRDNFSEIMGKIGPSLNLKVENSLEGEGKEMAIDLKFNSMTDFEPHCVVDQVEPLKRLLETRNKLRDLLTKADRSEDLETLLEGILQDADSLSTLSSELGLDQEKDEDKDKGDK